MVALHNDDASELHNFNCFIMLLCRKFEDPLGDHKAQTQIKAIRQGRQSVAIYTKQVLELVCRLTN